MAKDFSLAHTGKKTKKQISDFKHAEEMLRQKEYIIESLSSAIAIADLEGKMTYANPAFLQMWGFDNSEEFMGRHISEFWMIGERFDEIMLTVGLEPKRSTL